MNNQTSLPLLKEEGPYQRRVDLTKDDIRAEEDFQDTPAHLARLYMAQRKLKDEVEALLKDVNLRLTAITQMLDEKFDEQGLDAVRIDGRLVSVSRKPYPIVTDPEAYLKWVIRKGLKNKLSVHWQTTRAIVTERLENGEAPPPGVEVYLQPSFRLGPEPKR